MQGVEYKDYVVFPYASMLHTVSPLLKEIYCESHRYEEWAITGVDKKIGFFMFPEVLYIKYNLREELLRKIPGLLCRGIEPFRDLLKRFRSRFLSHQRQMALYRQGNSIDTARFIDDTCRFLSCGVFKEVFEYTSALDYLSFYMPVEGLEKSVLTLYQPLCLPHFIMYEIKLLYFAGLYACNKDEGIVDRCIDNCAYLTRFLMEKTPFDEPDVMKQEMERLIDQWGGYEGLVRRRTELIERHNMAMRESYMAERDILQKMNDFGRYQFSTVTAVKNCLKFIQFIATCEELKHILTVQTAKVLARMMEEKGLNVETAGIRDVVPVTDRFMSWT